MPTMDGGFCARQWEGLAGQPGPRRELHLHSGDAGGHHHVNTSLACLSGLVLMRGSLARGGLQGNTTVSVQIAGIIVDLHQSRAFSHLNRLYANTYPASLPLSSTYMSTCARTHTHTHACTHCIYSPEFFHHFPRFNKNTSTCNPN